MARTSCISIQQTTPRGPSATLRTGSAGGRNLVLFGLRGRQGLLAVVFAEAKTAVGEP